MEGKTPAQESESITVWWQVQHDLDVMISILLRNTEKIDTAWRQVLHRQLLHNRITVLAAAKVALCR
jgi:hypothetical protein